MSEITTPEWRTTCGVGLSAAYTLGMLIVFIVGKVGREETMLHSVEVKTITDLVGIFFALLVGSTYLIYQLTLQHVDWRVLSGLCCVFPLLSIVLMFFIPESPAWLVTKGVLKTGDCLF